MGEAGAKGMIRALIGRDLRRSYAGGAWIPAAFFLLIAILVPFAVGPDARLLARIGGGALWIAALTASLLPIERLIEPDRADGTLDQLLLHGVADESVAAVKIVAHWLSFAPPLLISAVLGSGLLALPAELLVSTLIALAVASPALAALAVSVAALTAGLPRAGALGGLLLLPLAVPLLIFGASASGDSSSGALLLEAAVSVLILAAAPFVTGAAIRASRS
jgi:heme exporter protein B